MRESCYNCGALATMDEHAPPECFFPEDNRAGLLTVPSCEEHNSRLSKDVEYVRNIICGQHEVNLVGRKVFQMAARSSYDRSEKLFYRTFSEIHPIVLEDGKTIAFHVELPRINRVMKAIAYAIYFHDFGKRNEGDFDVFSPMLISRSSLYMGMPDGYENLRTVLQTTAFRSRPVPQPKVFKYGISHPGEGQIQYRFEFYEGFLVYALTLPHRLSKTIYLPVTRGLTVFRIGSD